MLAALLRNVRRVSALLEEARGHIWRHQPRAIRAEAGAGAATGALPDDGAGVLGTDEARDPREAPARTRRGRTASAKRCVDTVEKGRAAGGEEPGDVAPAASEEP